MTSLDVPKNAALAPPCGISVSLCTHYHFHTVNCGINLHQTTTDMKLPRVHRLRICQVELIRAIYRPYEMPHKIPCLWFWSLSFVLLNTIELEESRGIILSINQTLCNVEGVSRSDRPIIVIGQLCSSFSIFSSLFWFYCPLFFEGGGGVIALLSI